MKDGRNLQAVLIGGAAGQFLSPDQFDYPLTYESARNNAFPIGSGVLMVLDEATDLGHTLYHLARFFAHESCGKCFPCQIGSQRQMEILHHIAHNGGPQPGDKARLLDVGFTMTETSLCGLGQAVTVPKSTTILDAAAQLGIEIPVICYHPHLTANGLCRICSVDAGQRVQLAACVTLCGDGMEIETQNEAVGRGRRTILEMLAATVNLDEAPEILQLLQEYEAERDRFTAGAQRTAPIYDDNPFYLRDYNQCINCWRCVQVCAEDAQYTFALSFDGRGFHTQIGTFMGDGMTGTTCVFCGQCVGVCPTGALKSKRQALLEQGYDPDAIFKATRRKRKKKKQSA